MHSPGFACLIESVSLKLLSFSLAVNHCSPPREAGPVPISHLQSQGVGGKAKQALLRPL